MSQTPFMPLWVSDFIGDTLDLDAVEIGAYLMLLMSMWQRGGSLPDDEGKLKRVARCGREWPRVWASIKPYFIIADGQIQNKRLTQELHKVNMKREVNSRNGARGGHAKALKDNKPSVANATNSPYQPEPYPEPEIEKEETNVSSKKPKTKGPHPLRDDWALGPDLLAYAERAGFTAIEAEGIAEDMRNWAKSNGRRKTSWYATYQGFVRSEAKRRNGSHQRGPPAQGPSYSDISRWAEDELAKLESQPNDHRPDPVLRLVAQSV